MVDTDDDRKSAAVQRNLWLLCALSVIDGMDVQLLPASFRALEADLGIGPARLAILVACQDVAFALAGPFWASLADNGFSRKVMMAAGATGWGCLTFALACVSNFKMMIPLRICNGVCLGLMIPISQSVVAESSRSLERGYNFGWIGFTRGCVGQTFALVAVTSISNMLIFGIEGWRVAFICVAFLSLAFAVLIVLLWEEEARPWTPEHVGVVSELRKFISYFNIPTFRVIVLQGMFGTIPMAALGFATMYFQYRGLQDWQAATISGLNMFAGGIGALLGGVVGDRLAAWSRGHGRPLAAQMSVFSGIPIVAICFSIEPSVDSAFASFVGLMFMLGVCSSWCGSGCNQPIFCEIVPANSRASAMAWEYCLEHASGHAIGPLAVGVISEHLFHYKTKQEEVASMSAAVRNENAHALGKSIFICTVVPWVVCFLLYGFLHRTYKHDVTSCAKYQKQDSELGTADERTRLM